MRLDLEKTLHFIVALLEQVEICYDLSRNNDLTHELECVKKKLEALIKTIETVLASD